jgi:hypothetical protein
LIGVQGSIKWHGNATGGYDSEINRHPSGMVVGKDRESGSAFEPLLTDPPAYGLGHPPQVRVGTAFELIVTLKFERDVIGPTIGALYKPVIESGHVWNLLIDRGEYTRKPFPSPRTPGSPRNTEFNLNSSAFSA